MFSMNIGETIRNYRLQKGMSQGDIEKRTGLLRCYLSRVFSPNLDTPTAPKDFPNSPMTKYASSLKSAAMPPVSMTATASWSWPW